MSMAGCMTSARMGFREAFRAFPEYRDEATGTRFVNLTAGNAADGIIYQTHPMWTPGMSHLVFSSDRSGEGSRFHAVAMDTGVIRPLLHESTGHASMTWNSANLYYVVDRTIWMVNVLESYSGAGEPRRLGVLPEDCLSISGTISVDAAEDRLYIGVTVEADKRWALMSMNLKTGVWTTRAAVDFKVGHVQANPYVPGRVMFCFETGGDSPQRTWYIDDTMEQPLPFYRETYGEWVTHEVWSGPDTAVFTLWPYDKAHEKLPHGVARADLHSGPQGTMEVLSQYPAWHTHPSPDGRWVLGDDFERRIWLIDPVKKERRLLTQGHLGSGCKTHPHASFTPDSRRIVFNSSRFGSDDILLADVPDWDSLPKA